MAKKPITYYFDEECLKRYPVNEHGEAIIDWGETIPGQKKERTLFAKNESKDRAILRQPYSQDEDQKIIDFPPNLMSQEVGKVILTFQPNQERIESLKAGWGFDVVIG